MTIATLMGTCLIFTSIGWSGKFYEPLALVVGGMICIAASNAGGTSQDLKTGFIIGATPRNQQLALFIGAIVSSVVIGAVILILDTPTAAMLKEGIRHAIGTERFPAPQAMLMATLDRGIQSNSLDWQFVMVGVFIAVTVELCGIKALAFAIGLYLPLSTTLPIFAGGALKGVMEWFSARKGKKREEDDLGNGSLFATGLIAGGALTGVIVAILMVFYEEEMKVMSVAKQLTAALGEGGYAVMGTLAFIAMMFLLNRQAAKE